MMPSCGSNTANLPLIDPLLDCREADVKFQGRFARFQEFFVNSVMSLKLALSGHLKSNRTVKELTRSNKSNHAIRPMQFFPNRAYSSRIRRRNRP